MKEERKGRLIGVVAAVMMLAGCGGAGTTSYDLGSGTGGTGLTNSFDSPAEMGVGDIMPIEFAADGSASVSFEGVDTSSRFIMVLGNAKQGGEGTSIQLSTNINAMMEGEAGISVEADLSGDENMSADEIVSTWMRALEIDYAINEPVPDEISVGKAMMVEKVGEPAINSIRDFRMLNSLSSSSSYTTVRGRIECIGTDVIVYVDTRVTDELDDAQVQALCNDFDDDLGVELGMYGQLSDIDSNDKLIVFMTMSVNQLGSLGGGIVTGFFYAGDLYARSTSNPVSNNGEIIYTMVPDPNGRWGVSVSEQFALENLIPAVLVHETQHAISYNQHVFINGGAPEEPWLNEALSHFTEDVLGLGRENPSRAAMYLDTTSTAGLVTSFTPNLIERGASFLFLRFLYEQHSDPDSFLRALMNTSHTGVENLEQAYGGNGDMQTFSQFMARWSIALAMTDRGLTSDPRYVYESRTKHPATDNWEGVCLVCNAEDGRGTVLNGPKLTPYYGYHTVSLDSSSLKYYEIQTVPDDIVIDGNPADSGFAVLIRTE